VGNTPSVAILLLNLQSMSKRAARDPMLRGAVTNAAAANVLYCDEKYGARAAAIAVGFFIVISPMSRCVRRRRVGLFPQSGVLLPSCVLLCWAHETLRPRPTCFSTSPNPFTTAHRTSNRSLQHFCSIGWWCGQGPLGRRSHTEHEREWKERCHVKRTTRDKGDKRNKTRRGDSCSLRRK